MKKKRKWPDWHNKLWIIGETTNYRIIYVQEGIKPVGLYTVVRRNENDFSKSVISKEEIKKYINKLDAKFAELKKLLEHGAPSTEIERKGFHNMVNQYFKNGKLLLAENQYPNKEESPDEIEDFLWDYIAVNNNHILPTISS
jgi:hypothetical protein